MRIAIVGSFGFPHGYAEVARVHAYASGLGANGIGIKVICLKGLEKPGRNAVNTQVRGVYGEIPFEYACGTPFRAGSFLGRRWLGIKGGWGLWRILSGADPSEKFDAIILFSNDPVWITLTVIICKLIGAKCIQEKSEYPFVYAKKTWWLRPYGALYTCTVYKLFDGIIAISTYLEEYCSRRIRKGAGVLRIPILVDTEEIKAAEIPETNGRQRILYSGTLGHPGEVASLILAFSKVAGKYPQWDLQIIGDAPGTDMLGRMQKVAEDLSLSRRVEFTGMVRRDEIPAYLGRAGVLALLRSSGTFSKAGFPTKLGEYLATGKPVVVTSVGDIPLYLQDQVNAYLVPPDNPEAFAQKLDEVLADYAHALEVGRKGRDVAVREFDYRSNCLKIAEFVRQL